MSEPKVGRLRRLALRGAAVEVIGYGAAQALRLGSNLIITRLVAPELFGLMAMAFILNQGLVMLSDVGLELSVVQSKRGDDQHFLNTAWSIQAARGASLYAIALLVTWPFSTIYQEPAFLYLIPVGASIVAIEGFNSTSLGTLRRRLQVGKLNILEITAQVAGLAVMIPWAFISPTVWALLAGAVTTSITKMTLSHLVNVGYRNRFEWEASSAKEILHFGSWIFLSSFIFFFSRQADRLLLGRYLGMAEVGVYSIAVLLTDAMTMLIGRLVRGILYPMFSRVKDEDVSRLGAVYYEARRGLDLAVLPALGVLSVAGSVIVDLLYTGRYQEAGWIFQALCVRVAIGTLVVPGEMALTALGLTKYSFYLSVVRGASIVVGIPLAWSQWGIEGLVWVAALSPLPALLMLAVPLAKHGLFRPVRELLAFAQFGAGAALGWAARSFFGF